MDVQDLKNRFGIIGNSPMLNRALEIAVQVAPTTLSVLITGESGVGKEVFSKIIHHLSSRKHGPFIAVNCGAIPEGTIDSELFGHEKGSFTGATESRKGYFEVVNGGTIFLDEVADLPLPTQVRLLRVLETGEFIRVGSSKVQKTDVRVVAATNINMLDAVRRGKFREDLYYRLNTVPIRIPSLRERPQDIGLLFRKFATDFAEKYRMPVIRLSPDALDLLQKYRWPGNIRQLKNLAEQISVLEHDRDIDSNTVRRYLPDEAGHYLPALQRTAGEEGENPDIDVMKRALLELRKEVDELKKVVLSIIQSGGTIPWENRNEEPNVLPLDDAHSGEPRIQRPTILPGGINAHEEVEESLKLEEKEADLIVKALKKHKGKRKLAAAELGISERTLYRKIKEYGIKNKL